MDDPLMMIDPDEIKEMFAMMEDMKDRDPKLFRGFDPEDGRRLWCCRWHCQLPRALRGATGYHTYEFWDESAEVAVKRAYHVWLKGDWKTR